MPPSHYLPVALSYGRESQALWAVAPTGSAVVFVHGFGGQSVATWSEFDRLLPSDVAAQGWDVLFFGYDGLRTPAQTSASDLRTMIDDLVKAPDMFFNGTVDDLLSQRRRAPQYHRIVVVGHSLGAVVARKALLDAHRVDAGWLAGVSLLLFAPAHRGASLLNLAGTLIGAFDLGAVLGLAQHFSVLQDLEPGCAFLEELREATVTAIEEDGRASLRAQYVGTARRDRVVMNVDFCAADAPPVPLPGSHMTVCKPSDDNNRPLQVLRSFL